MEISEERDIVSEQGVEMKILHRHGIDADEALKVFEGLGGESIELDESTNKRLLRRIDLFMMPV
jgi:MFS transporter, ACS family, allantoate permease